MRYASDPSGAGLATAMGGHARLGRDSWLNTVDPSVLDRIAQFAVNPIVERPIVCCGNGPHQQEPGTDDYVTLYEPGPNDQPQLRCTVLQDGVPVFRARIPSYLEYNSRMFPKQLRVMFKISSDPPHPYVAEFISIQESPTSTRHDMLQKVNFWDAVNHGFRAQNELGIELRLTHAAVRGEEDGVLTPMVALT